jgi:hypothetical protein
VQQRTTARGAIAAWALALVASFAVLGVLGGHTITYHVLALLHHGGEDAHAHHGYLTGLGSMTLLALLVSWVGLLLVLVRAGGSRLHGAQAPRGTLLVSLTVPPLTFLAQETLERVATATHPRLHLLLVGSIVQALVGLLVHALASATLRGTAALAEVLAAAAPALRPDSAGTQVPARRERSIRLRPLAVGIAGRAPPARHVATS